MQDADPGLRPDLHRHPGQRRRRRTPPTSSSSSPTAASTSSQQIPYTLDPATLQEQAAGVIPKLKAAGVTTVILSTDPIAPKMLHRGGDEAELLPRVDLRRRASLVDTNAFGRTYDQKQWAHAFGISYARRARVSPAIVKQYDLHTWYFGDLAPADDTYGVLYPQPGAVLRRAAGGRPEADRRHVPWGLFGSPDDEIAPPALTAPLITYGDHGLWPEAPDFYGIDDFTEIWWDPTATGEDEIRQEGTGMIAVRQRRQALSPR